MRLLLLFAVVVTAANAQISHRLPPEACNKPEWKAFGDPVFLPWRTSLKLGLSLPKASYGSNENFTLHVWVLNTSHAEGIYETCTDLDYFKLRAFEIYNQAGQRVLSRWEIKVREHCRLDPVGAEAEWTLFSCSRNIMLTTAPDSCTTRNENDFTINLRDAYDLPPGRYRIQLHKPAERSADICTAADAPAGRAAVGLSFEILPP